MPTPRRPRPTRRSRASTAQRSQRAARAHELRDQGQTIAMIARELGVSPGTVTNDLRDAPRSPSPRPRSGSATVRTTSPSAPLARSAPAPAARTQSPLTRLVGLVVLPVRLVVRAVRQVL